MVTIEILQDEETEPDEINGSCYLFRHSLRWPVN